MKFLDRLSSAFSVLSGKSTTWGGLTEHFRNVSGSNASTIKTTTDFINAYQFISYVGKNVQILAGDIAALDYSIKDLSGEEVKRPEVEKILDNPNSLQTGYDFRFTMASHLLLDGNCFIVPDTTNGLDAFRGAPTEAYIINPSTVDIYDAEGQIISASTNRTCLKIGYYLVRVYSRQYRFSPDEIIHIKVPSPHNSVRGMGLVEINAASLDADRIQNVFNKAFFSNGSMTNMVVSPDKDMGVLQYKLFKEQFLADVRGQRNWFKPIFAPFGSKIDKLDLNHKDMQYIEQKKFTREDIDSFFGLPPIISGAFYNAKYDSAKEQLQSYNTRVLPRWTRLLEYGLESMFPKLPILIELEIPTVTNGVEQNQIARDMFDRGAINGNEYRKMVGVEVDESDELLNTHFIGINYIPLTDAGMVTLPSSPPTPPADGGKSFRHSRQMSARQRSIHLSAKRTKLTISKNIYKGVIKFYKSLKDEVIANLEKGFDSFETKGIDAQDPFAFSDIVREAKNSARSFFTSAVALGIRDFNESFNADIDPTFKNSRVKFVVEKLSTRYEQRTIDSRREELRKLVTESIDKGESVQTLKANIEDWMDTLISADRSNGWRADRIARTEASYAWDQAAKIGYDELGIKTFDVVGCEDNETDCNAQNIDASEVDNLEFHPNHTGSLVPSNV